MTDSGLGRIAGPGRSAAAPLSRRFGCGGDGANRAVLRFCEGLEHPPADPVSAADLGSGRRRALVYRLRDYRRIYYAKALRHVPVSTSIEDRGLYFRVT